MVLAVPKSIAISYDANFRIRPSIKLCFRSTRVHEIGNQQE
jgi:hypothetical protein